MKLALSVFLLISMSNDLYLAISFRHPTPFDQAHNLSFMKVHISADEKVHGHLSLREAKSFNDEDCDDTEYTYWVRAELNEWLMTLSKAEQEKNSNGSQPLTNDLNKVTDAINTLTQTCNAQEKYLKGESKNEKVEESSSYNYDSSCIMSLVNQCKEDNNDCFSDPKLCPIILPQLQDLEKQIEFLQGLEDPAQDHKDILEKENSLCCADTCLHCEEIKNDEKCTKCDSGQNREIKTTSNVKQGPCECIEGYYEVESSDVCMKCDPGCVDCNEAPNQCTDCKPTFIETDKNGYVECTCELGASKLNPITKEVSCGQCSKNCKVCESEVKCTQCEDCWKLNQMTFTCLEVKEGCFLNPNPNIPNEEESLPCDPLCKTCENSADNCLTCHAEHLRIHKNNTCECGQQNYGLDKQKDGDLVCQLCDASCDDCNTTAKDCKDCPGNKEKSKIGEGDNYCYPVEGYFCKHCNEPEMPTMPEPGVKCDQNCLDCDGSAENCTLCDDSVKMILEDGQCNCVVGFKDVGMEVSTCEDCHITCLTCSGALETECKTCDDSRSFTEKNSENQTGICTPIEGKHECKPTIQETACPCLNECKTCNSDDKCTECKNVEGSTDVQPDKEGQCVCQDGTRREDFNWKATENYKCVPCSPEHTTCKTVEEGGENVEEPILCNTDHNLNEKPVDKKCTCADGSYAPDSENVEKCYPCNKNCSKCEEEPYECTDCKEEEQIVVFGQCTCPTGKFIDTENKCQDCHDSCKTCVGSTVNDCVNNSDPNTTHPNDPNRQEVHYIFLVEAGENMKDIFNPETPLAVDSLDSQATELPEETKEPQTKYEVAKDIINELIKQQAATEKQLGLEDIQKDDVTTLLFDEEVTEVYKSKDFDEGLEDDDKPDLEEILDNTQKDPSDKLDSGFKKGTEKILEQVSEDETKGDKFIITIIIDNDTVIDEDALLDIIKKIEENGGIPVINIIILNENDDAPNASIPSNPPQEIVTTILTPPIETPVITPEPPAIGTPMCLDGYLLDDEALQNNNNTDAPNQNIYCLACVMRCKTCSSITDCQECMDEKRVPVAIMGQDTTCQCKQEYDDVDGQCLLKCLEKQYRDMATKQCNDCQKQECVACSYIDDGKDCSECPDGQYLNQIEGDENFGKCIECEVRCHTCDDGSSCKSCMDPFVLNGTLDDCECKDGYMATDASPITTCQIHCDDGQYVFQGINDEGDFFEECRICADSIDKCAECKSPNKCDICIGENRMPDLNNECNCTEGFYEDVQTLECKACSAICKECSDEQTCTDCNDDATVIDGTCVCDKGFTKILDDGTCEECESDKNCETCTETKDVCTTCKGIESMEEIDDTGACVCVTGYFRNAEGKCAECQGKYCETCSEEDTCLTCDKENEDNYHREVINGECKPKENYAECDPEEREACKCHWTCKLCSKTGDQFCTDCYDDFELPKDQTEGACKPKEVEMCYAKEVLGKAVCDDCDETCYQCSGPKANDCTQCLSTQVEIPEGQKGVCKCEEGKYLNSNKTECKSCLLVCDTCLDGLTCSTCKSVTGLTPTRKDEPHNNCPCKENYYEVKVNKISQQEECLECPVRCKTCKQVLEKVECIICAADKFEGRDIDSDCIALPGFFENDPETPIPGVCSPLCLTCMKSSDDDSCLECSENRTDGPESTNFPGLELHSCICKDGKYEHEVKGEMMCLPCDVSCKACTGPKNTECKCLEIEKLLDDCIKCEETKFEEDDEGNCVPKKGTYLCNDEITGEKTTCPCHDKCEECFGKKENNCLECRDRADLNKGKNTCDPEDGTTWKEKNDEPGIFTIEDCDNTCETCSDIFETTCIRCAYDEIDFSNPDREFQLRKQADGSCQCKVNQFRVDVLDATMDEFPFICQECAKKCKKCTETDKCIECVSDNVKDQVDCDCKRGYKVGADGVTCETRGPQSIKLDLLGVVDVNNITSDGSIKFDDNDGNDDVCKIINTVITIDEE